MKADVSGDLFNDTAVKRDADPRVCVVVLNWNGWRDTVECLDSVFRGRYAALQVVLIDNGSADGSLERIREWADGATTLDPAACPPPVGSSGPPLAKPLAYQELSPSEVCTCGGAPLDVPLVLVRNETNLGFAAGANLGLRYARARGFDYAWLLNNDTVVSPDALVHLVARMTVDPRVGLCGSTLLYYDQPDTVQALGGFRYNIWLGVARQIEQGRRHAPGSGLPADEQAVETAMFGVQGAAVLVSRRFLEDVGLLGEEYFLYAEEQEWAVRARHAGYRLGYAARSIVYHKEGRSTGNTSLSKRTRSYASDFYQVRSRLLFTRRFFPLAVPTVCLGLVGAMFKRLHRGQLSRISMIAGLMMRTLLPGAPSRLPETRSPAGHSSERDPFVEVVP
jgi:GT2 family glycosyltransferase